MRMLWALVGVLLLILILFLWQYNALVGLRNLLKNAWSDVDVYLKRRAELIPNLVAAVKAYASHERTVLEALTEARSRAVSATGPTAERAAAEASVGSKLVEALVLAENYPDLKASENFMQLQRDLVDTEKLLAGARQYYNAVVRDYNIKLEAFPSNLVAGVMTLKPAEFFEVDSASEREAPSVSR